MNKKIFLPFIFSFFPLLSAGTGLEIWWDYNIIIDLDKRAELRIEQEYEFEHGLDRLFFIYSEQILFFKWAKWLYAGPYVRLAQSKSNGRWNKEVQPGFIMRNWFKLQGVPFFTRLKIFRRIVEGTEDSTAIRFTLGINVARTKKYTFYIADEIFWNYAHTNQVDLNYSYIGVNKSLTKNFSYDIYYNVYEFKPGNGKGWRVANALTFGFNVKF